MESHHSIVIGDDGLAVFTASRHGFAAVFQRQGFTWREFIRWRASSLTRASFFNRLDHHLRYIGCTQRAASRVLSQVASLSVAGDGA